MAFLGIALLCLAVVPGCFSNDDIHNFMSHDEVKQVFHTDHHSVPKYEVVKVNFPGRLHKRDLPAGSKMHIRAFGEDINLWLHPADPILAGANTPVYYAKHSPNMPEQVEFTRRDGLMGMVGRIFEDPYWVASFVIGTDNSGATRVNGLIGARKIAVRPLPPRVAEEYRRRRRSVDDLDDEDSSYHFVFQTDKNSTKNYPVPPVNKVTLQKRAAQVGSGLPDTLYPEVLVIVEYSMYKEYGQDIYGLLEYILAFWNGVDLKYRSLESPKFRFHISGIVLAEDPLATPYISNHSVGSNAFNTYKAMPDAGKFFNAVKDTFPFDSYDIPVTMTRQKFGEGRLASILGQAYVGKACVHATAGLPSCPSIMQDDGAFSGVFVAAHELGHLFGAPHDEDKGDCIYSDGYLMSFTPWYTTNSSDFSKCSVEKIEKLFKTNELDCLANRPASPGKIIPELMPGRIKNLAEQCKTLGKGEPCESTEAPNDVCVNIYCRNNDGECVETGTGALAGTTCEGDNNKFCLHMRCVSL